MRFFFFARAAGAVALATSLLGCEGRSPIESDRSLSTLNYPRELVPATVGGREYLLVLNQNVYYDAEKGSVVAIDPSSREIQSNSTLEIDSNGSDIAVEGEELLVLNRARRRVEIYRMTVGEGITYSEPRLIPIGEGGAQLVRFTTESGEVRYAVIHSQQNEVAIIDPSAGVEIDTDGDPLNGITRISLRLSADLPRNIRLSAARGIGVGSSIFDPQTRTLLIASMIDNLFFGIDCEKLRLKGLFVFDYVKEDDRIADQDEKDRDEGRVGFRGMELVDGEIWLANRKLAAVNRIPLSTPDLLTTLSDETESAFLVTLLPETLATVEVGSVEEESAATPSDILAFENGTEVGVGNFSQNSIDIVDRVSGSVLATLPVGEGPVDLTERNGLLYVVCAKSQTIHVIDIASRTTVAVIS